MKKDITSEEKLLNLIRKKNPEGNKEKTKTVEGKSLRWMPSVSGDSPDFSRTSIRVLLVFCLGLVFYIASHIFLFKPSGDDLVTLEAKDNADDGTAAEEVLPSPQPFSDYAKTIDERDIFMSALQRAQSQAAVTAQPETVTVQPVLDFSQNFKLVGIILDSDPKAVVEDLKNQRTLFLSYGDQLEGAVLKEIRDGKVIFTINDQSIELVP